MLSSDNNSNQGQKCQRYLSATAKLLRRKPISLEAKPRTRICIFISSVQVALSLSRPPSVNCVCFREWCGALLTFLRGGRCISKAAALCCLRLIKPYYACAWKEREERKPAADEGWEACGVNFLFAKQNQCASINFGLMHAARAHTHTHTRVRSLYWSKYTSGTLANNKVYFTALAPPLLCTAHSIWGFMRASAQKVNAPRCES